MKSPGALQPARRFLSMPTSLCDVRTRLAAPWLQQLRPLPPPAAAAENSSEDSASDLPADLAARGAHRALGY